MQENLTERLISEYAKQYGTSDGVRVYRAPGRINLIGEHTDYNQGFVLPVAIDLACYVAAGPGQKGYLELRSANEEGGRRWPVGGIGLLRPARHWSDYVAGVAQELEQEGYQIRPLNVWFHSTVPIGAGLSSSAALEMAAALALLGDETMSGLDLVEVCHAAEAEFIGLPCGIMDQFVSYFGAEGHAVLLDCQTSDHFLVKLPPELSIIAVNSHIKHDLYSTAYEQRVQECAAVVEALDERYPDVASLRDASLEMLDWVDTDVPADAIRRARHVITENRRVELFVKACESGDLRKLKKLMADSHRSLRDDYEVSCPELDFLVSAASEIEGVWGSRMTGGGFGGCTVNLVESEKVPQFQERMREAYRGRFGIDTDGFECKPSRGAERVI